MLHTDNPEQTFWHWFSQNSDRLFYFELHQEELLPEALEKIQNVHHDLVFEIGPEIDGKRDFIISANGLKEAFPAVIELSKAAPIYDSWNIVPFRQRKEDADLEIEIEDIILSPEDILFDYDYEDGRVNLEVYIDDIDPEDERVYHIVFILLDNIIGEYDVEMKIGQIEIHTLHPDMNQNKLRTLDELPRIIDTMGKKVVN